MNIKFDIDMTTGDMFRFLMNNTYRKVTGIIWIIFSVVVAFVTVITWNSVELSTSILLIISASMYTIINPVMLYFKARAQIRKNASFNSTLHYAVDEESITVSQGELSESTKWSDVYKAVKYGNQIVIYVTSLNVFVWPLKAVGEYYQDIVNIADKTLGKRNKIKRK